MLWTHSVIMWILLLFFIFAFLPGFLSSRSEGVDVREGEIVALTCNPGPHDGAKCVWQSGPDQKDVHSMSEADWRRMSVVLHGNYLVILNASAAHGGNYHCSTSNRNGSSHCRFILTVYSPLSKDHEEKNQYPQNCTEDEFCMSTCPDANTPPAGTLNMTNITWHKLDEDLSPSHSGYFPRAKQEHGGRYTCVRSYQHHGRLYNKTFTVSLHVKPKGNRWKFAKIIEPKKEVFYVDLDSPAVIDCKAILHSVFDEISWLSNESFVDQNNSKRVYYNYSEVRDAEETHVTASLVFRKVLQKDFLRYYTCKLESSHQDHSSVNITLALKTRPSLVPLAAACVSVLIVVIVTGFIYVNFKVHVTLFMRDVVVCHHSSSDGKNYDIFMMSYRSEAGGLKDDERKMMESILEEKFNYSLCLLDRDVLPGQSVSEAVLDLIQQSRAVVLVPASPDPGLESGVLSVVHAALVDRQTRLVFVTTETSDQSDMGSVQEAVQLLSEAGGHATWRGPRSMGPSSFFWKQLRYHLPATRRAPRRTPLLPQSVQDLKSRPTS